MIPSENPTIERRIDLEQLLAVIKPTGVSLEIVPGAASFLWRVEVNNPISVDHGNIVETYIPEEAVGAALALAGAIVALQVKGDSLDRGRCRLCGCQSDVACNMEQRFYNLVGEETCRWVDSYETLCSRCVLDIALLEEPPDDDAQAEAIDREAALGQEDPASTFNLDAPD